MHQLSTAFLGNTNILLFTEVLIQHRHFTELRTRQQNYEDSRIQRKQPEVDSSVAMQTGIDVTEIGKHQCNTKFVMSVEI